MNKYDSRPTIPVDTDVPIPDHHRLRYPWKKLAVGDSFFTTTPMGNFGYAKQRAEARLNIKMIARTVVENGKKGTRIWRIQ